MKRKVGRPRRIVDDDDDLDDLPPPPDCVEPAPAWDCPAIAKQVQAVLDAVEAPQIDRETMLVLQRYLYRRNRYGEMFKDDFGEDGRGYITMLLRTILESEGNQDALVEPIVSAVASCMRTIWTRRGLEWIAAFDQIPLVDILHKLRELDLFPEKELEQHYATGIQRRLWRIFGPDVVPEPVKVKRRPKLTRPSGISEQSRNDVLALRKKPKAPRARRPLKAKPSATTSRIAA
jgi:hypothetical protein